MLGLSSRFDVLIDVGMHAMAGTPNACLCHTQSSGYKFRVNGREFGEMAQTAYLTGMLGIPWIFTSGDLYACREAEDWVPGMVTAPVKEGLGLHCAVHMTPTDARKLIREKVQQAVAKAGEFKPLTIEGPVTMEVEREEPWPAALLQGAERVDAFTIRYTGPNIWSVIHEWYCGKPDLPLPK